MKILSISFGLILCLMWQEDPWIPVEIDPALNSIVADSADWTYPWYVVRHEDHFENTFGEPITSKDTAHLIRNSFCNVTVRWGHKHHSYRIPFASAEWSGDTLRLSIFDQSASNSEYLSFSIHNGKFLANHDQSYPAYEVLETRIDQHSLTLNAYPFRDSVLKGRVAISLDQELLDLETELIDTVSRVIQGTFIVR